MEGAVEQEVNATAQAAGFPAATCRSGYRQAGPRLCISTNVQNATQYDTAARRCRVQRGRVATYEDLYYLYIHSGLDASYNPSGKWIGNMVGDDRVLCGNRSRLMAIRTKKTLRGPVARMITEATGARTMTIFKITARCSL